MSNPVLCEAIGTVDGANVDFQAVSPYYPGSLWAYLDGQLIRKTDDDGPIELGGASVRMKRAPRTGSTLHFYYQEAGSTTVPFPVSPALYMAMVLEPLSGIPVNLRPIPGDGESLETSESTPEPVRATNLAPMATSAFNLVPTPLSAEEV